MAGTRPAMTMRAGQSGKILLRASAYPDSYGACPGHPRFNGGAKMAGTRPAMTVRAGRSGKILLRTPPYPDSYGVCPGHLRCDGGARMAGTRPAMTTWTKPNQAAKGWVAVL